MAQIDVRLGSLADLTTRNRDVRFTPESGLVADEHVGIIDFAYQIANDPPTSALGH